MLYVTTRNDRDTFTAHKAMLEDRAGDGGFYVPFRAPDFTEEVLQRLREQPFDQRIADVLNLLFQTRLTQWDIRFCIGRNPVKLVPLRHRIVMGEFWHNPDWSFAGMERSLARLLCRETELPGSWLRIAIRIGVLTAVVMELPEGRSDISVLSGDFLWPVSIWYARQWGLPVGNIIICCNENQNVWDLICHGQLRTDSVSVATEIPEADIPVPAELERLIHGCSSPEETARYLDCCRRGVSYYTEEKLLSALQKGNYVSVVSSSRIRDIISGALGTHGYLMSAGTALAYAGLLDYRAKKGALRSALVISQKSPQHDAALLADILGITESELKEKL